MTPTVRPPTFWQRLVGAFVAVQLLYLLIANGNYLLYRVYSSASDRTATTPSTFTNIMTGLVWLLTTLTNPYALVTGQNQGWSLFAPNVPRHAAVVFVEMRWPDGTRKRVESDEQPADLKQFWRPVGTGRLLQYELHLRLLALNWSQQEVRDDPHAVKRLGVAEVQAHHDAIEAFLRWRLEKHRRQHPGEPTPTEVVLWARAYKLKTPGESVEPRYPPQEYPLFRWRPGEWPPSESFPFTIELFDLSRWLKGGGERFNWVER